MPTAEELPRSIAFEKGSIERLESYSAWSYEGIRDSITGHKPTTWYRTKLQDDDYVTVLFPVDLAEELGETFIEASAFWNSVVSETEVTEVPLPNGLNINSLRACQTNPGVFLEPGFNLKLVILALVQPDDGPGGTLGSAGACAFVEDFPRIGVMQFDSADVDRLVADNSFGNVIKHEMGHVVGIGLGAWRDEVRGACTQFNPCNNNPRFVGENAVEAFRELGGTGNLLVADQNGAGTANAHWRERTFQNELMTGFLSPGNNPFSLISARSLQDAGYTVNLDVVDRFQIPGVPLPPGQTPAPTYGPEDQIYMGQDASEVEGSDVTVGELTNAGQTNLGFVIAGALVGVLALLGVVMITKRHQDEKRSEAVMNARI